jgi:hypothetical protein
VNELKVKVVDVGHGLDGNGAGVTLVEVLVLRDFIFGGYDSQHRTKAVG